MLYFFICWPGIFSAPRSASFPCHRKMLKWNHMASATMISLCSLSAPLSQINRPKIANKLHRPVRFLIAVRNSSKHRRGHSIRANISELHRFSRLSRFNRLWICNCKAFISLINYGKLPVWPKRHRASNSGAISFGNVVLEPKYLQILKWSGSADIGRFGR